MAKKIWQVGEVAIRVLGILAVVFVIVFWVVESFTKSTQPIQSDQYADILEQTADSYFENQQYPEAEQAYQTIIETYPGTDYEFTAHRELANLYVESDNMQAAEEITNTLINNFPKHPDLPETLYKLSGKYNQTNKFEEANRLYRQVIDNHPDSLYADKSILGIATNEVQSLVLSEKFVQANEAFDKLAVNFSDNPDLPEALYWIVVRFNWVSRFKDAKRLYQKIVDNYPDNPWADKARFSIARADIMLSFISEDYDRVKEALDKLAVDFADEPDLPQALYWIVERFERAGRFEDAKQLFQKIIDNYPDTQWAEKARFRIAKTDIKSLIATQDYDKLQEALDKLYVDFSSSPDLAESIYWIAEGLEHSYRFEDAKCNYQKIIDNYPESSWAEKAEIRIAKVEIMSLIMSQDYDRAKEALNKLFVDFAEYTNLPETVHSIGLSYYSKACMMNVEGNTNEEKELYRKAIEVWECVIREFPSSGVLVHSYYCSAICYAQELGEYRKGIDYFQTIVDNWPCYEYAWDAQYLIGEYYEKLKDSGAITEPMANYMIEKAYKAVIQNYPNCEVAEDILMKLENLNSENMQP